MGGGGRWNDYTSSGRGVGGRHIRISQLKFGTADFGKMKRLSLKTVGNVSISYLHLINELLA